MKEFKKGIELRLEKEDLVELLKLAINAKILGFSLNDQDITKLTLHPNNKYVAIVTLGNNHE